MPTFLRNILPPSSLQPWRQYIPTSPHGFTAHKTNINICTKGMHVQSFTVSAKPKTIKNAGEIKN
jgi:hypothetical protein